MNSLYRAFAAALAISAAMVTPALAAEPEKLQDGALRRCRLDRIQVTTGATSVVLEALGYEPQVSTLAVPVTYASLKNKDIDVFLGNWMPSMTADIQAYLDDKSVEQIGTNLEGAGYGLVVPQYVADAGVKSLADLGANKDKFGGKIYGIEGRQ